MKYVGNTSNMMIGDEEFRISLGVGAPANPVRPGVMIRVILLALPLKGAPPLSMQDAVHGSKVVSQCDEGVITLEDAEYTWLRSAIDTYAPFVMGVHAALLKAILDGAGDVPLVSEGGELPSLSENGARDSAVDETAPVEA